MRNTETTLEAIDAEHRISDPEAMLVTGVIDTHTGLFRSDDSNTFVLRDDIRIPDEAKDMADDDNFPPRLAVGELRARLAGVPDNTPVLYQRIEDFYFEKNGWTTTQVTLDHATSDYVVTFTALACTDDEGREVFVINAHY